MSIIKQSSEYKKKKSILFCVYDILKNCLKNFKQRKYEVRNAPFAAKSIVFSGPKDYLGVKCLIFMHFDRKLHLLIKYEKSIVPKLSAGPGYTTFLALQSAVFSPYCLCSDFFNEVI